jgi:cytochrome c
MRRVVASLTLASIVAAGAAGAAGRVDPAAGEAVYARCQGCHALAQDRTGPHHCGLFGRRAGSVAGFAYSPAMQASNIVWTGKTLDLFLKDPRRLVPGTSMGYDGVKDAGERAALIAYLRAAGKGPECKAAR